jgi:hypothetical protein
VWKSYTWTPVPSNPCLFVAPLFSKFGHTWYIVWITGTIVNKVYINATTVLILKHQKLFNFLFPNAIPFCSNIGQLMSWEYFLWSLNISQTVSMPSFSLKMETLFTFSIQSGPWPKKIFQLCFCFLFIFYHLLQPPWFKHTQYTGSPLVSNHLRSQYEVPFMPKNSLALPF